MNTTFLDFMYIIEVIHNLSFSLWLILLGIHLVKWQNFLPPFSCSLFPRLLLHRSQLLKQISIFCILCLCFILSCLCFLGEFSIWSSSSLIHLQVYWALYFNSYVLMSEFLPLIHSYKDLCVFCVPNNLPEFLWGFLLGFVFFFFSLVH